MTRNSHMDSMEAIEVNLESPAARRVFGIIKLMDHSSGFAIPVKIRIVQIVPTISAGGEKSWIKIGIKG